MQRAPLVDQSEAGSSDSPQAHIMQMICGYRVSQVVRAFAYFGIADELENGPSDSASLGEAVKADPGAIERLLRAGTALGLVSIDDNGSYLAMPLLRVLRTDATGSMRSFALGFTASSSWLPFGRLVDAIKTGDPQSREALGCDFFEHFSANPDDRRHFTAAMDRVSEQIATELVKAIDASRYASGVDVGGATGILIRRFVEANPGFRGIVFDREQITEIATTEIEKAGFADTVSVASGDFFQAVPKADLYLLKWIMHDWDDQRCIRILSNCKKAMNAGGAVVLVEMKIDDPSRAWFASLLDMSMLTLLGGRERSLDSYDSLLRRAGLVRAKVGELQSQIGSFLFIEAKGS